MDVFLLFRPLHVQTLKLIHLYPPLWIQILVAPLLASPTAVSKQKHITSTGGASVEREGDGAGLPAADGAGICLDGPIYLALVLAAHQHALCIRRLRMGYDVM